MHARIFALALIGFGFAAGASANHHEQSPFLTGFLNVHDRATEKTIDLAEAIPENNYGWRPGEGVRSVQETIGHIAGANYFIGRMLGATLPDGVDPRTLDKTIKTKEQAIAALKASSEWVRQAVKNVPASDYGTEVELFGKKAPKIQLILVIGDHASEHLGQLIAYARSNGVVPPWSVKKSG